jgi:tripartite-type tricarboxylate transporter receptor subunit TctC
MHDDLRDDHDAPRPVFQQAQPVHIGVTALLTFRVERPRAIVSDKQPRRKQMKQTPILAVALAAALGCALGAHAQTQTYPSRPLTVVVPFPPGGPTDTVGRVMAEHMKTTLGQTVVIENVTGAGGTIGMGRVARADPDGYSLVVGQWTTHVGGGAIYPLTFHVLHDFEPVSLLTSSPLWIVGKTGLPANNLKEFIAWLKDSQGKASAATIGAGSAAHMCMIYFQNHTGTSSQFVPYRGGAPALQDLVAGQVDWSCLEASQTMGHFRGGRVKVFAVMAKNRWFGATDVPTVDEAGAPGLHFPFWHGLWAPKGTPRDIVGRLNGAVVEAFADPATRKRFADLGMDIPPREQLTPQALYDHHKAEIEKWWPIIKAANIKVP